jgi:hypothetical protein
MGACRLGTKDVMEIGCESSSKLLRSSGVGAVWVLEVSDSIFSISFGYGLMEERSIAIT